MKTKIKLITLSVILISTMTNLKAQSTIQDYTKEFFEIYEKSPESAVDFAFKTNKWIIERNKDGIDNIKNQLTNLIELVGDYYGYEKIVEKSIGESYTLISYMVKYDRQPIRFTFIFYKANSEWKVQNFKYDQNLDDELEEAGKIYMLKEIWD